MPCKYNGNVCGLLGNADHDPTNDNLMPNGSIATSDAELGDSWLVNSFPDFLNLNTAQCEPGVSVTDVEPECPAMDLRSAANVCKMIIDPRYVDSNFSEGPCPNWIVNDSKVDGHFHKIGR